MRKVIFETRRYIRVKPKIDFYIVTFFFVGFFLLIAIAEFIPGTEEEYYRAMAGFPIASLIFLIYRFSTSYDWVEHYKELINWIFGATKFDRYVFTSLLNISQDFFVLVCLIFWVDWDHVSFVNVSVVGIVFIVIIAFLALKNFITNKLEQRQKKDDYDRF